MTGSKLPPQVDVLIVGAGPTGLMLANLLGALGISTLIVESRSATSNIPRAIVLDDEGARTLQAVGLHSEAVENALEGTGSRYIAATGEVIAEVGPGAHEFGFPKRLFISQPSLERTLADGLQRFACVELRFDATLLGFQIDKEGVRSTVRHASTEQPVRARWLVACDGGRSPVREALDVGFTGSTYEQDWIVLDLANDPSQERATQFFCDPKRPTVCIPAPAGGRRYEFMVMPGENREDVLKPEFLAKLLSPYRSWTNADVIRAAVYTFHARVASRWRVERVLLAGDAAHLTPPFAGQGMNAGLRDAANLAWKLALEIRGSATAALLDTYEEERRAPCEAMIDLAVLMGKVVMPASAEDADMQRALMRLVQQAPALKQYIFEMKFKPRPEYASGALLRFDDDRPASLVGKMIPQPRLVEDGPITPLDDAIGYRFALISQSDIAAQIVDGTENPLWSELSAARLALNAGNSVSAKGTRTVHRDDLGVARPFRTHLDQILLVRPDRYVAAALDPLNLDGGALRVQEMLRGGGSVPAVSESYYSLQGAT